MMACMREGGYWDDIEMVGGEEYDPHYYSVQPYVVAASCPCGPMKENGAWFECDNCGDRVRVQDVWEALGLGAYKEV